MREIKFRVFNTAAKCMYPPNHFALTLEGKELQLMNDEIMSYQPNSTGAMIYMQYVGLKDKNGVEIYEGDILLGQREQTFKVEYWGMAFGFIGLKPYANGRVEFSYDGITNRDLKQIDTIEIIGNIWENGELLEVKDEQTNP